MPIKKVVAIHQPNFFPWLGYFDKIARSDVFILMDNVQFSKKGAGVFCNRVKLVINGQATWITMPVVRSFHGTRIIKDMQIDNNTSWRRKLLKTVQMHYARTPFFEQVSSLLENLINNPTENLMEYNKTAIRAIATAIGLDTSRLVVGSTLHTTGASTDLLISMTHAMNGTAYLCGGGASGYQEDDKFAQTGVELIYQQFHHPIYPQVNTSEFIPGLSIIDALMNCGFNDVRCLLQQGVFSYEKEG